MSIDMNAIFLREELKASYRFLGTVKELLLLYCLGLFLIDIVILYHMVVSPHILLAASIVQVLSIIAFAWRIHSISELQICIVYMLFYSANSNNSMILLLFRSCDYLVETYTTYKNTSSLFGSKSPMLTHIDRLIEERAVEKYLLEQHEDR